MSMKVDVVGQYISQVLLPRLNSADELYMSGDYRGAILKQQGVIRTLQRISEDDLNELGKWEKEIYDILDESKEITDITEDSTQAERANFLASKFSKKYKDLDWKIWGKLHKFGYFATKNRYGLTRQEIENIPPQRE